MHRFASLARAIACGPVLPFAACDAEIAVTAGTATMPPSFAVVSSELAVTPASAVAEVGDMIVLTALGPDGKREQASWSSSDPDVAWVGNWGKVYANRPGTVTITAESDDYGSATAVVTVTDRGARPTKAAPPVAKGIWISKAELDALPANGAAWHKPGEVKSTADAEWIPQPIEHQAGQKYNIEAMAGALVFARLYPDPSAEAYRTKVVKAIRTVMAFPDSAKADVTAPNRFLGTWAITADLINLPAYDRELDAQFRDWLKDKLDQTYRSGKTVRTQMGHANNQGSWASFSLAAASAYLGDRSELDRVALRYRRWLGNTSVRFTLKWTDDQSFQMNPQNSATWVGINPQGARRNGHNFDGLQPSDQNRGTPMLYDPDDFPNSFARVRYNETSLHGVLGAVLILHRAGYTDLVDASNRAILRAAKWIRYAADAFPGKGYKYFSGPHEAARPLIGYLYPNSGLPGDRARPQLTGSAYGYAWTFWTHSGRRIK